MSLTLSSLEEPTGPMPSFSPVGLERLDISPPTSRIADDSSSLDHVDWDEVHRSVQCVYREMADRIQRRWPSIRWRAGRSSGRTFPLFTFLTFVEAGQEDSESVIVGLIFEPIASSGGVLVRGDIGGEESGRIDFELDDRSVPGSRWGVLPVALEMATLLGAQIELIVRSISERHPPPSYDYD